MARGWYSRGYLPHLNVPGRTQFVTWRLGDSIPLALIETWEAELRHLPLGRKHQLLFSRIEKYLDAGHGSCLLRNPVAAKIVQDELISRQSEGYCLHAWTIMPNHVHALNTHENGDSILGDLIGHIKGGSSRAIHLALGGEGSLWQRDYFDRMIRDEGHFERVRGYIEWNASKAKLCTDPRHWAFSSSNSVAAEKAQEVYRHLGRHRDDGQGSTEGE